MVAVSAVEVEMGATSEVWVAAVRREAAVEVVVTAESMATAVRPVVRAVAVAVPCHNRRANQQTIPQQHMLDLK